MHQTKKSMFTRNEYSCKKMLEDILMRYNEQIVLIILKKLKATY